MSLYSNGYTLHPRDSHGVRKGESVPPISFSWLVPRKTVQRFLKGLDRYPGLYVLFGDARRAYIGETDDLTSRLSQHVKSTPGELGVLKNILAITDCRTQNSYFSTAEVRKILEQMLINWLPRDYKLVNVQGKGQRQSTGQSSAIVELLSQDIKKHLLNHKVVPSIPQPGDKCLQPEATVQEAKEILAGKGHKLKFKSAYEGEIDGKLLLSRGGSPKPRGWQVTIRGKWRQRVANEQGYYLLLRIPLALVPFSEIRKIVPDLTTNDTVDIFFDLVEKRLYYRQQSRSISRFLVSE